MTRFEIVVGPSEGEFAQMSFVNSIWTIRGGTHVAYIVDQIVKHLAPVLKSRNKGEEVKPVIIRNRHATPTSGGFISLLKCFILLI